MEMDAQSSFARSAGITARSGLAIAMVVFDNALGGAETRASGFATSRGLGARDGRGWKGDNDTKNKSRCG